jgi:hypothetical protein
MQTPLSPGRSPNRLLNEVSWISAPSLAGPVAAAAEPVFCIGGGDGLERLHQAHVSPAQEPPGSSVDVRVKLANG